MNKALISDNPIIIDEVGSLRSSVIRHWQLLAAKISLERGLPLSFVPINIMPS